MPDILRGRRAALAAAAVAGLVAVVLLVPAHPEAGMLHALGAVLPSGTLAGGSPGWWAFEDAGNIGLFVPVGLVAAALLRPARALLAGVAVSALGETAQLVIPSRHASAQDVLMNAIGVAIGVAVTVAVRRGLRRRQARATRPHSVQAQ